MKESNDIEARQHISGLPSGYLRAPVTGWPIPSKLVASIDPTKIKSSKPPEALKLVRDGFQAVSISKLVPPQLAKFATKCHDYSFTKTFEKSFLETYTTRRAGLEDEVLQRKARALAQKGVSSAVDITERALDKVRSSTLAELSSKFDMANY